MLLLSILNLRYSWSNYGSWTIIFSTVRLGKYLKTLIIIYPYNMYNLSVHFISKDPDQPQAVLEL